MPKFLRISLLIIVFLTGCDWIHPDNKNATLVDLTISGGTIAPNFEPSITSYTATVSPETSQITVTATTAHHRARVTVNGTAPQSAGSGVVIPLSVGDNTITVLVTAEKKKKQLTYTIIVTRPIPTYSVGGTVSGLTGTVVLQNNGGDDLSMTADGPFTFATVVGDGSGYDVTVSGQPVGQTCSVGNGNGTIAGADVTDISVTCVTPTYTVGGSVSGLTGTVTLQNNGADDLAVAADGPFTFATSVINGGAYDVTVSGQPAGARPAASAMATARLPVPT